MLEVASAVTVVSILVCSMIPLPQDILMEHYVHWFRLLLALVVAFGCGLQLLQTSEPLPPWAIFTKLTSSHWLVYCGTISYGLYLVHWVLIVWLGDRDINTTHSMTTLQGRQAGMVPWARDVAIGFASIMISTASFWLFEKPLVQRSAKARASHVITSGMVSMACVAMLVLVATAGCTDPNPTFAELPDARSDNLPVGGQELIPSSMLFLGDSQAYRLAQVLHYSNDMDKSRCSDSYAEPWGPFISNRAYRGRGIIMEFGSNKCTYCTRKTAGTGGAEDKSSQQHTAMEVERAHAPYVFVMDNHFFADGRRGEHKGFGGWNSH